MQGLISKKSKRFLTILDYVLTERKPVFIEEIMVLNQCSKKTVYNDFDEINDQFGLNLYQFDYNDEDNTLNVYQFMQMKRKILHQETKIHLILELFFHPYQDLVDLAILTNKSESSVREHLIGMESYLNKHQIRLVYNHDKKYSFDFEHLFGAALFISDLIRISAYENYLPDISEEHLLSPMFFEENSSLIEKDFQRINKIMLCAHHTYPQLRVSSLEELLKPYQEKMKRHFSLKRESLHQFLITHGLDITTIHVDYVLMILVYAYVKQELQPHRVDSLMNRYDYFYFDASIQKTGVVRLFDQFIEIFFDETINMESYKTEVFFNLYNELESIQVVSPQKIGVYSDIGRSHVETLCREIKKTFSVHQVEPYNVANDYDLIVTTSSLKPNNAETPVLFVDDYINPLEIQQIYAALCREK